MSTITMLVVGFAPVYLNKVEQTSLNKKEAASLFKSTGVDYKDKVKAILTSQ